MANLEHLKKLIGDASLAARFLQLFRSQMPLQMDALRQHIDLQNWDAAGAEAHAIKGQLRYLGEEAAATLAYRIEQLAEQGGGDGAAAFVAALDEQLKRILEEIDTE